VDEDLSDWVAARGPRLVSFGYLLCHDRDLAQDLAQEALARLHLRWRTISRDGDVEAYVRRSMLNQMLSWRRRRSWSEHPVERSRIEQAGSPAPDHADDIGIREEVWALLGSLPLRQRAVIVLRFYEDRTDAEIANLIGCREATVRSHASKALARLRDQLDHQTQGVRS
jgi:RNA polymerase sigma-70 factor (sigma-E family)